MCIGGGWLLMWCPASPAIAYNCGLLRAGGCLSPREQFDVGLVAVTSVLFLARHFHHDTQIFQHLNRSRRCRKARVQLLANAFDREARHHRQHFKQAVARRVGLGRLQQALAVSCHQTRHFNDVALCVCSCYGHPLQEEDHPGFPIALGPDGRQTTVVLGLVLLQITAKVHQRLDQQSPVLEQGGDQQSANTPVAVQKGVDGFELCMDERDPHHRWQFCPIVMNEALHIGQQNWHVLRRWRYESGIARSRAADPVL